MEKKDLDRLFDITGQKPSSFKKTLCLVLPSNLFYSTGIPVCILVLKKCKKFDDVLFINASEHFEKGKRQNQLLPEHIEKIIDTYTRRNVEPRYSKRVPLDLIEKEHDFNLNISRFISTAQADEEIDLLEVHEQLVAINKRSEEARPIGYLSFDKSIHFESLKV